MFFLASHTFPHEYFGDMVYKLELKRKSYCITLNFNKLGKTRVG